MSARYSHNNTPSKTDGNINSTIYKTHDKAQGEHMKNKKMNFIDKRQYTIVDTKY